MSASVTLQLLPVLAPFGASACQSDSTGDADTTNVFTACCHRIASYYLVRGPPEYC